MSESSSSEKSSAAQRSVLEPPELEERLFAIEKIALSDHGDWNSAFVAVKDAIFQLRIDIAKEASRRGQPLT